MLYTLATLTLFPAAMAYASVTDLLTMTIPNRVSLALAAGFLLLAPFAGLDLAAIGAHAGLAAAMLCVGFAMFAMGWIGGGDAKLFAATALWMGPAHMLDYAIGAALLGGALTVGILFLRTTPLPAGVMRQDWIARLRHPESGVPYGIALAAAGLWVYPETMWMLP